jgi:protein ImuB
VLAPRFGPLLARRLRQALGEEAEPISPTAPPPQLLAHRVFAEPIATPEDLARVLRDLAVELCRVLETEGLGARRLDFVVQRVDGSPQGLAAGTSRPSRDPDHLARLFADRLETIDPGFGIEVATLAAPRTQALAPGQVDLMDGTAGTAEGLATLIDRLESRLGPGATFALTPRESHLPERAVARGPALAAIKDPARWRPPQPLALSRPLRLLEPPEPVEALALLPDHPPVRFRWRRLRHRVVRAEGPERIAGEWWPADAGPPAEISDAPPARDYFRIEDEAGRRYWLYRAPSPDDGPGGGRWFLHGLFA